MDVEEFRRCLGDNLKYLRKKRNLTQSALAEVIGLEIHNLNRIENGKSFPQAKTLVNLINFFDIAPYELFVSQNDKICSIVDMLQKHPNRTDDIFDILSALIQKK